MNESYGLALGTIIGLYDWNLIKKVALRIGYSFMSGSRT